MIRGVSGLALAGILVVAVWYPLACARAQSQDTGSTREPAPRLNLQGSDYPWLADWTGSRRLSPLAAVLETPEGLSRTEVAPGSFAAWLRGLPVSQGRLDVRSYRGTPVASRAAAVIALDLGRGDLQQCADSLIRLHAEYLWASDRAELARYHFTSGYLSSWPSWVRGQRVRVNGARVEAVSGARRSSDHDSFRAWLQHLFIYAGTISLAQDSQPVPVPGTIRGGDFFVLPGSPGHTVMVLDTAEAADGRRYGLVGQGYIPAQDFHVIAGTSPEVIEQAWFPLPEADSEVLHVPTWAPFPRATARRFDHTARHGNPCYVHGS